MDLDDLLHVVQLLNFKVNNVSICKINEAQFFDSNKYILDQMCSFTALDITVLKLIYNCH